MNINVVDTLFNRIPSWKQLTESQKLKAFDNAYRKLVKLKNENVIINDYSSADNQDISTLYVYRSDQINLSAYGSGYNNIEELAELSDDEKVMILNIAQAKISTWRNAAQYQEYQMNTTKEDITLRTPITYSPALALLTKILNVTTIEKIYNPALSLTATIKSLLFHTKTFIPSLTVSTKLLAFQTIENIYQPVLNLITKILPELVDTKTYQAILTISTRVLSAPEELNTYSPTLTLTTQVIEVVDYTDIQTYSPSLTLTASIINKTA